VDQPGAATDWLQDLRHSHATILRKQHVDLGTVQKELGHSSSEITARVYDQSGLEDDRQAIERALTFAPPRFAAGAGRVASW